MNITYEESQKFKSENKQRGNKKIKDYTSIIVHDYFIHELKLKKSKLLLYSKIYEFTINCGWYSGSANYLATLVNINIPNVCKLLNEMADEGLLIKYKINDTNVKYKVASTDIPKEYADKYILIDYDSIDKLSLTGNALLVYSYIDNISKNTKMGGVLQNKSWLARKLNITRNTLDTVLNELQSKNLIRTDYYAEWMEPIYTTLEVSD